MRKSGRAALVGQLAVRGEVVRIAATLKARAARTILVSAEDV
jgi:hypothetical protein